MKMIIIGAALAVAAASAPAAPPAMTAKQEADFQKVVAGRTAGKAQSCVSSRLLGGNKSYGEGVIVFEGTTNSVVYVNRPPDGCPELRYDRALRSRQHNDQLCNNDLVTVFDPRGGMTYGSCTLGQFVPYKR